MIENVQADKTVSVTFKQADGPVDQSEPFTAIEDTYVLENNPTLNANNQTGFYVQTDETDYYGLVKFDLSSIPEGSEVESAELKLYCTYANGSQIFVAESDSSWSESSVTWNTKPISGFDYTFFHPISGVNSFQSITDPDLTNLVKGWVDGTVNNYGIYLYGGNVGDSFGFRSSEYSSSSYRPQLLVTYTPPPPPDLIITSLSPNPSPVDNTFYVGQSVDWAVTVKNNGSGPADSSRVGYYLGTSPTNLSNRINSDPTSALVSGASETDSDAYTFSASDEGQRYLICKADYGDDVDETGEGNNTRVYGPFNVIPPSPPVHFSDPNLKAVVEANLGVTDPTEADMLNLTSLSGWSSGISDLTGIEHAINLSSLNMSRNSISDISALSGLTELTNLSLYDNQISDVSALSKLTKLIEIQLHGNQISDISALSGLTKLDKLILVYNQISDISALAGLTELTELVLNFNQISDISALSGLEKLTELFLAVNQIIDISALSGLTELTKLSLAGNQISDISALAGLTKLTELELPRAQIIDISVLSGLTELTRLVAPNTQISDLSPLSGLTKLTVLGLYYNVCFR